MKVVSGYITRESYITSFGKKMIKLDTDELLTIL